MQLSGSSKQGEENRLDELEDVSIDFPGGEAQFFADALERILAGSLSERLDDGENILLIEPAD